MTRGHRAVTTGIGDVILLQGVAMHRPNEPGYNPPDVFVIDDWR